MELLDDFINTKTQESKLTVKALGNKTIEDIIDKLYSEGEQYVKAFLKVHIGLCAYVFQLAKDILPSKEMLEDIKTTEQMTSFFENNGVIDIIVDVIKSGNLLINNNASTSKPTSVQTLLDSLSENDIIAISEIVDETGLSMDIIAQKYVVCNKNKLETIKALSNNDIHPNIPVIEKPKSPVIEKPRPINHNQPLIRPHVVNIEGIEYCTIKTDEFSRVYIKNRKIMYRRSDDQPENPSNGQKPINRITGFRDMKEKSETFNGKSALEFKKKAEHMFDD